MLFGGTASWAQMVPYARSAGKRWPWRAHCAGSTRRDKIAFCGYHGWAGLGFSGESSEDEARKRICCRGWSREESRGLDRDGPTLSLQSDLISCR